MLTGVSCCAQPAFFIDGDQLPAKFSIDDRQEEVEFVCQVVEFIELTVHVVQIRGEYARLGFIEFTVRKCELVPSVQESGAYVSVSAPRLLFVAGAYVL